AASLLARHWPAKGSRDAAALALSGGLVRAGWPEEEVSRFVEAVAVAAGDEESRMRAGKAGPTARKVEDGKKVTGWPRVGGLLVGDGLEVVRRVREWLGMGRDAPAGASGMTGPPAFQGTPRPLSAALLPVPALAPALLPALLRGWLVDIAERGCFPLE